MLAIVIPTFNERKNIQILISQIFKFHPQARVVVVDDNSPDQTAEVVKRLQKKYEKLDLIIRKEDKGRGASCIAGFIYVLKRYPKTTQIVEMDSDLSHNPEDIKKLITAADDQTISIGSRYVLGSVIVDWPKYRLVLSKLANTYIRFFLGIPVADLTMGFRCYSREALESLDFSKVLYRGFITLSEIAYMLKMRGFSFVEVPITLRDRTQGKSNATLSEVLRSFMAIQTIRRIHGSKTT